MRPECETFLQKFLSIALQSSTWLIMAALRSRYGHYIFALWFLSFSSPNLSGRRLDVHHRLLAHMVWP